MEDRRRRWLRGSGNDHKTVSAFHAAGTSCGLAKNVVVKGKLRARTPSLKAVDLGGGVRRSEAHEQVRRARTRRSEGSVKSGTKTVIGPRIDIAFAVGGYTRGQPRRSDRRRLDISFFTHHA